MREIKFRAFDGYGWQYLDQDFYLNADGKFSKIDGPTLEETVYDWPVVQFTGLLDKNGKEIYEGDILKTPTDKPMVVSYNIRFASFYLRRTGWLFVHYFGEAVEANDCKVIGNIYETPELLTSQPL